MCGICGVYDFHSDSRVCGNLIGKMMERIRHRGPDGQGKYINRNLGLGFTRLSIVGLDNGDQPLFSADGSVALVCNGEIFNYKPLRREMQSKGYSFRTDSDVEVLIALYQEYGFDFFHRINGQFSFALYDDKNKLLFCARDHVGITPFFYTVTNGSFIFASEIKAILEHPQVVRKVDLTGLDQMLTFPGLVAPRTMFDGINSLPGGHYLVVSNGKVDVRQYWDLVYPMAMPAGTMPDRTMAQYLEELDEVLTRAVCLRLQADVPVGFYLSGGLDSSLIAAKIRQLTPERQSSSFSIDFEDRSISERKYQQIMARFVHSKHHETLFGNREIGKYLRKAIYHSECPLKETYNTASLALSKMAADNHIKVVLSGEGADELFGGYIGYRLDPGRFFTDSNDPDTMRENSLRERLWGDANFFYERDYLAYNETKLALYSDAIRQRFRDFDCMNFPIVDKRKIEGRHVVHKRSFLDFKLRLSDHLIADHGDRMNMANGVEGRYPFLDKDLLEMVAGIPPGLLLKDMTEKYILKRLASHLIPHEIAEREKFSFVAPGSDFLLKENIEWVHDILSTSSIARQGYFDPIVIERLKKKYTTNGFRLNVPFDNDLLIIVLNFSIFLEEFDLPGAN